MTEERRPAPFDYDDLDLRQGVAGRALDYSIFRPEYYGRTQDEGRTNAIVSGERLTDVAVVVELVQAGGVVVPLTDGSTIQT
jgi:hypothetical protein